MPQPHAFNYFEVVTSPSAGTVPDEALEIWKRLH